MNRNIAGIAPHRKNGSDRTTESKKMRYPSFWTSRPSLTLICLLNLEKLFRRSILQLLICLFVRVKDKRKGAMSVIDFRLSCILGKV